jgi:hypothetical protein
MLEPVASFDHWSAAMARNDLLCPAKTLLQYSRTAQSPIIRGHY